MNKLMDSAFVTNLLDKIGAAWGRLSERDQKILLMAAPLVVFLLFYLVVFQPIHNRYQQTQAYKTELADTLVWLYENAALVERMQNPCVRQRLVAQDGDNISEYAKKIARRSGVQADIGGNGSDLVVTIKKAPGNRALAAAQSFVCHGYVLTDLQLIRASETAADVDLSFRLSASSLLRGG